MNIKAVLLLIFAIQLSNAAFAQFYIGCDSLIATRSHHYRRALNTIGKLECYQDSSSNQLLLVNSLKGRKILYLFHYQVAEDSIYAYENHILLNRCGILRLGLNRQVNQLMKYRNFRKIYPVGYSDSAFVAAQSQYDGGIDFLEALWQVTDKDIPCDLYIDFWRNTPRHSTTDYYYLDFNAPCLEVKAEVQ